MNYHNSIEGEEYEDLFGQSVMENLIHNTRCLDSNQSTVGVHLI
mgnify:CR=1 FL=1